MRGNISIKVDLKILIWKSAANACCMLLQCKKSNLLSKIGSCRLCWTTLPRGLSQLARLIRTLFLTSHDIPMLNGSSRYSTCKAPRFGIYRPAGNRARKIITLFIAQIWSGTNKLCKYLSCWTSGKSDELSVFDLRSLCMFYGFILCASSKWLSQLGNCDQASLLCVRDKNNFENCALFEVNAASAFIFLRSYSRATSFLHAATFLACAIQCRLTIFLCIMHDMQKTIGVCKCR